MTHSMCKCLVDVINVACVGNRQLRKTVEEALFIFPAVVCYFTYIHTCYKHTHITSRVYNIYVYRKRERTLPCTSVETRSVKL